jgi:hypothetical protein
MRRVAILIALAALSCGRPSPRDTTSDELAQRASARFTAGDVMRYRFEWSVTSRAEMSRVLGSDLPVEAGLALAGDVQLRVHGPVEGGVLLAFEWTRLERHAIEVMGMDVLPPPAADALLGEQAFVVVDDEGEMRDVYFGPASAPIFRRLMAGMLAQTDLRVLRRGEAPRPEQVPASSGLAEVVYAWDRPGHIVRELQGYARFDAYSSETTPHVEGVADIELGADGAPRRLVSDEIVWVPADDGEAHAFHSQTKFSLVRESIAHEPAATSPVLSQLVPHDLQGPPDDEEARRLLAQQFAGDLQLIDVQQAIRSAGLGGLRPSDGFMVEVTGMLRGWPELAFDLESMFAAQHDHRGRALTIDLLASAGTPEAQAVLCRILAAESTRALPEYALLIQRLSFLWRPMPATAKFLLDAHARASDEGDTRARLAALYPMGTVARRVAPVDPIAALAMRAVLGDELEAANEPAATVAALAGIGNVGAPDDADEVLAYVDDDDAEVRAQAASSLRHSSSRATAAALFALLADDDGYVARAALAVLDHDPQDPQRSRELAVIALGGAFNPQAAGKLASALGRRRADDTWVRAALVAMRERAIAPDERARIDQMLEEAT